MLLHFVQITAIILWGPWVEIHDEQSSLSNNDSCLTHHTWQSIPQPQVLACVPALIQVVPKQECNILLEKWKPACGSWKQFSYPYGLCKKLQLHCGCPKINSLLDASCYIRDFIMCSCLQNIILDFAQIDNYFFDGRALDIDMTGILPTIWRVCPNSLCGELFINWQKELISMLILATYQEL